MSKIRAGAALLALVFTLTAVLVSCKTPSDSPKDETQTTAAITASDSAEASLGEASSGDASSAEETADTGSGGVPEEGGIAAPDVDGTVSTPIMWHVTAEGGGELYLLGSIHAGLEDTCLFPEAVYDAFDSCDALAVENDIIALEEDLVASVKAMRLMVYTDGSTILAHIPEDTYNAAKAVMEEAGFYNRFMDYYCPVLWQQTVDQILTERTQFRYENGVDRYFLSEAKRLGKTVLEIEDYMETYASLASLSGETQEFLLRETVSDESLASYGEELTELYGVWKSGDPDRIGEYFAQSDEETETGYTAGELGYIEEYNDALLTKRNAIMVEKAGEYLSDGKKVFYVVGLAHMIGDDGIVESLSELGYEVEIFK